MLDDTNVSDVDRAEALPVNDIMPDIVIVALLGKPGAAIPVSAAILFSETEAHNNPTHAGGAAALVDGRGVVVLGGVSAAVRGTDVGVTGPPKTVLVSVVVVVPL